MSRHSFSPKGCKSVITLDYDIPFFEFEHTVYKWLRERAGKLGAILACWQSPSGNTHCSMCLDRQLDEIERLTYETLFLDDPIRILYNLQRLVLYGRLHDRLFVEKILMNILD